MEKEKEKKKGMERTQSSIVNRVVEESV